VLASNAVNNNGSSQCKGDFGIAHGDPTLINGTQFDTNVTCTGLLEVNSSNAENALLAAEHVLNVGVTIPCDVYINDDLDSNLAGKTLVPGTYCFNHTDAWVVGGDLYLDGGGQLNASWIFKIDGRLIVGSHRPQHVYVFNGGSPCNVYWLVNGVVKVASQSQLIGTVMSYANIKVGDYAFVQGRVISIHGNVTLDDAIIDNSFCSLATHEDRQDNTNTNTTTTTTVETRSEQNITFTIWRADLIPLPLEGTTDEYSYEARTLAFTNYQGLEYNWTDPTGDNDFWWIYGFEIVSLQNVGPLSINITSTLLTQAQLELIEYSSAVELWWVGPYPINLVYRDTCEFCEYNSHRLCHVSNHGPGLYYFVVVNYTDIESSSSSTGGGGGGGGESSSSSTGVESSTGDIIATGSETGGGSLTGTGYTGNGNGNGNGGRPGLYVGDLLRGDAARASSISLAWLLMIAIASLFSIEMITT